MHAVILDAHHRRQGTAGEQSYARALDQKLFRLSRPSEPSASRADQAPSDGQRPRKRKRCEGAPRHSFIHQRHCRRIAQYRLTYGLTHAKAGSEFMFVPGALKSECRLVKALVSAPAPCPAATGGAKKEDARRCHAKRHARTTAAFPRRPLHPPEAPLFPRR